MGAPAAAVDLPEPPVQQPGVGAAAFREPLDLAGDRGQAEHARAALPGGLAGQVAHHPGGLAEPAGARGQRRDQARPRPGAQVREPGRGERTTQRLGRVHPGAEVPAEQKRLQRRGRAAGQVEQLPDRGADRDLAHARLAHRAEHGDQHRAGFGRRAGRTEPGRAVAGDEREVRERLDVLYQCRRPVQAALGEPRRRRGGRGDSPLDPPHDRARLAGHEPVRRRADLEPHPVEAGPGAFGHGLVEDLADVAVHHDHRLPGPGDLGREHRAVQDEVRRARHEHPVLHAGRLAFGAVRHHHGSAPGGDRGELAGGGKPGATPAGEPGPGHLRYQRIPLPPAGYRGQRPVPGGVPGQADQVGRASRAGRQQARQRPGQQQAGGHRSVPRAARSGPRSQESRRAIIAVATAAAHPHRTSATHQIRRSLPAVTACPNAAGQVR